MKKRGQVTIFIIIAIIIVVAGGLIFAFYPKILAGLGLGVQNPQSFIQNCLEKDIKDNVKILSIQGGSVNPQNYILYNDEKIEYLCYTNEYYIPCVMQKPMLRSNIESEIQNEIKEKVLECFNSLEESYRKRGFEVALRRGETTTELLPEEIRVSFNTSLVLRKGEDSDKYDLFRVVLNNNLYELVGVAESILEWETTYGDSETTIYMNYYPNIKVEKKKQSDGTTIYILSDRNTKNKFQFASRSIAWPPGYGL